MTNEPDKSIFNIIFDWADTKYRNKKAKYYIYFQNDDWLH